jgi:hypothetical protein
MSTVYNSSGVGKAWYNMRLLSDEETDTLWQQLYTACQSPNLSTLPSIQNEILGYIKGPNNERYVIGFLQPGGNANYTLFVNSKGLAEGFILNSSNRGTISLDDEIIIENSLAGNGDGSYSTINIPDSVIHGTVLPPIATPTDENTDDTPIFEDTTDISTVSTVSTETVTQYVAPTLIGQSGAPEYSLLTTTATRTETSGLGIYAAELESQVADIAEVKNSGAIAERRALFGP